LAVFLVFVVVRNNFASAGALRRLSVAVLINGALLSLFALVQYFSAPPHTVYWTIPAPGAVFGPFISRTHFPFYINLCIGLGLGLFLSLRKEDGADPGADGGYDPSGGSQRRRRGRRRSGSPSPRGAPDRGPAGVQDEPWWLAPLSLLHNPLALWICLGLVFMLTGVAFSMSRGGVLALFGGFLGYLGLRLLKPQQPSRSGAALAALVLVALGLMAWLGFERVEARLATLWKGEVLHEDRLRLWASTWPLVKGFPLTGTGYGTFGYVEPLNRDPALLEQLVYEHAHNEYLEALVEGGFARLALSLTAIALVFWYCYRAMGRYEGRSAGGLVIGACFAFTTLVIQSFVDFGLHVPAIALLTAVLCAHLGAMGDGSRRRGTNGADNGPTPQTDPTQYAFRLWGAAPLLGAATAVVLALVLYQEGRQAYQVEDWRHRSNEADSRDDQIAYLEAAAGLAPDYARVRVELAQAHNDAFDETVERLQADGQRGEAGQAALAFAPAWLPGSAAQALLAPVAGWGTGTMGWKLSAAREQERLTQAHLLPALRWFVEARDRCPLLSKPHVRIAANVDQFQKADRVGAYLQRAKLLASDDPELWFVVGQQELLDDQPDQAWRSWRRCLELSGDYLPEIVSMSAVRLGPREMVAKVLPDRPDLLVQAADLLYPTPEAAAERQPFMEKALDLLRRQPGPLRAEDLHLRAVAHAALGRTREAVADYQAALSQGPRQVAWRYELAQLLYRDGRLSDARRELEQILKQQPDHPPARELLRSVERQLTGTP
jgi:tetratricopeptide (TPR) repeat protein